MHKFLTDNVDKIAHYLYKTEQGRNLLHIIIGFLIALTYNLFFKLDGYRHLYITLFVGIVGLSWELYHWKVNKSKFDIEDGTPRLQYVNNSDVIVITDVDA